MVRLRLPSRWGTWVATSAASCLVAACVTAGSATAVAATAPDPKPASKPEAPLDVTGHADDVELGDQVRTLLSRALGDSFAGSAWDWDAHTIRVRLTTPSDAVTSEQLAALRSAQALTGSTPVVAEYGARSEAAMRRLARQLIDHSETWAPGLPGKPGGGYNYKQQTVVLTIMSTDAPDRWREAVAKFGNPAVVVREVVDPGVNKALEASRVSDIPISSRLSASIYLDTSP